MTASSAVRWLWAGLLLPGAMAVAADMPAAIEHIKPSIVMVGIYNKTGAPQFSLRGTGFIVGDGRTVATNAHVVADLSLTGDAVLVVRASTPVGRARPARVVTMDRSHDLALLTIDGSVLPALLLQDSDSVREGQSIGFTGFPIGGALGFSPVTHRGMVSAVTPIALPSGNAQQLKGNLLHQLREGSFNIFQLDATAYPGNSGGPMFDPETGQVVGVISMVLVKAVKEAALSQPSGISYAVPSNYLRSLLASQR